MAAAIAAALQAQLVADFVATHTGVIRLTPVQIMEMNTKGVSIAANLAIIDEDFLLGVFPDTDPALKLSAMTKMRLWAFRQWAVDQRDELATPTDIRDAFIFDDDLCAKFQSRLAEKGVTDKDSMASKPTASATLTTFDGNPKNWMPE
jgi:hypothetical protein